MKALQQISSVLIAIALCLSSVVQYHHHDEDGTMCMHSHHYSLSCTQASKHCHTAHPQGIGNGNSCDESHCALHLSATVDASDVTIAKQYPQGTGSLTVALQATVTATGQIAQTAVFRHYTKHAFWLRLLRAYSSSRPHRAPPIG